jgi:sialate O-acetylesterase
MTFLRKFPLLLAALASAQGAVKLPSLVSDHMVLQQNLPVRIWGQAGAGEAVSVEFNGQKLSTAANAAGKWAVYLNPMKAGGPYTLTASGENTITVNDVLVGEVWVGSGQSNMEFMMVNTKDAQQEIAQANYPMMRIFKLPMKVAEQPAEEVEGHWVLCSPETVGRTSAVGYFFSREIHKTKDVPVGFIESDWGGTPAQAWTSRPVLEGDPALKPILDEWEKTLANYPAAKARYEKQLETWKQKAAEAKKRGEKLEGRPPQPPPGPGHQNSPAGLYNAMVAPLIPYAIRGVIWYQGESNAQQGQAILYRRLFEDMIENWWQAWGEGSFPFLFVQLANFAPGNAIGWPELRDSQLKTLELRDTGMAVTIDIGNSTNIHPTNKQDVGRRLALAARSIAYGEKLEYSGPIFRELTADGAGLRIWFDHVGGGLHARGGDKLTGFAIAGKDRHFVPAEARIEGETVVVSTPEVKDPVAVRYAWASDPVSNLINQEGLPASPFRSDDWDARTQ